MPAYHYQRDACEYCTPNVPDDVAAVILQDHFKTAHPVIPVFIKKAKPMDDQWASFINEWESFKSTTELPHDGINIYLVSCCEENLRTSVLRAEPRIVNKSE